MKTFNGQQDKIVIVGKMNNINQYLMELLKNMENAKYHGIVESKDFNELISIAESFNGLLDRVRKY